MREAEGGPKGMWAEEVKNGRNVGLCVTFGCWMLGIGGQNEGSSGGCQN